MADGLMAPAGLAVIERAKADGSWTALDAAEAGIVPGDLQAALERHPGARDNWDAFPRSARKQIIGWVGMAKRAETRAARIEAAASLAAQNIRATDRPSRDRR